ncbi:MAG: hypothetical protein SYR96_23515 [Actinomycetota bacterium]|nr:hypothetical protein [Actinomycetota bacterium]
MTNTFETWELPARIALGDLGVRSSAARAVIDDVKDHCARTGESPFDTFGEPRDFAARTAAEQPAGTLEPVDREGMTPRDYLGGQLFGMTLVVIPASLVFAAIGRSWTLNLTVASLTGLVLLLFTVFWAGAVPPAVRASGRPHLVKYVWAATVPLIAGTALAFTTLPREHLFALPVVAVVAVAAVALAVQLRSGKDKPAPDPASDASGPAPSFASGSASSSASGPASSFPSGLDDDYFERLNGLLIGRYDLKPERAAELTREARARAALTDLGPVEEYARQVQQGEPERKDPFWRTRPAQVVGLLVGIYLGVQAFLNWRADGVWWAAYLIAVPAALGGAWYLFRTLRGKS